MISPPSPLWQRGSEGFRTPQRAMKPLLAITMGDPDGVGPEIVVKGLGSRRLWNACRPVVIGRRPALEAAAGRLGAKIAFDAVGTRLPPAAPGHCPLVETGPERDPLPPLGRPSAAGGRAALEAVSEAICLALDGRVAGIVTAPISKEAI